MKWLRVIDESGVYDSIEVVGSPDESSKEAWELTVNNGLLIAADNVVIRDLVLFGLHVGVEIRGKNVTIEKWSADLLSGDLVQGDGSNPRIRSGVITNALRVLPYKKYHPDIIHWRGGCGGEIDGIEVIPSEHKWARRDYQGCMFSDNSFKGWSVKNLKFPEVHPEHAVTFAEAHDCHVESVWGGGAVRFRSLNGRKSTGCTAIDIDGSVEGIEEMNDIEKKIQSGEALPRGIRNRNPGNVEMNNANQWLGLATKDQMTRAQADETRFCVFTDAQLGIRALVILLVNYQRRYRLTSVSAMLNRFAPRQDNNDTNAYVAYVAARAGVGPKDRVSMSDYQTCYRIVEAIIQHENGMQPYDKETIREGIGLAGIAVDTETSASQVKPAITSTENVAVVTAGTGTAGYVGLDWIKGTLEENQEVITEGLQGLNTMGWIQTGLLVFIAGSLWYLAWRRGEASFLGIR